MKIIPKCILKYIHITVIIAFCIFLNLTGKHFTSTVNAPLWLDSCGTLLASLILGPIAGSISGIVSFLVFFADTPIYWLYALSAIPCSVIVSLMYHNTGITDAFQFVCTGALLSIAACSVAIPVNLLINHGYIGNIWGNALIDMLKQSGNGSAFSCFFGQAFIEIPDKITSLLLTFVIYQLLIKIFKKGEHKENEETN